MFCYMSSIAEIAMWLEGKLVLFLVPANPHVMGFSRIDLVVNLHCFFLSNSIYLCDIFEHNIK